MAIIRYNKLIVEDFVKNKKEHADRRTDRQIGLCNNGLLTAKNRKKEINQKGVTLNTKENQEKITKYFDNGKTEPKRNENINRSQG